MKECICKHDTFSIYLPKVCMKLYNSVDRGLNSPENLLSNPDNSDREKFEFMFPFWTTILSFCITRMRNIGCYYQ